MAGSGGRQPPWLRWSGVGMEFTAAVVGFALFGFWIDRRYETSPWGVLIGMALGLTGASYNLYKQTKAEFGKKKSEDDSD